MFEEYIRRFIKKTLIAAAAVGCWYVLLSPATVRAFEILGTGTDALIGNDWTDLGDDGDPEADIGYDAIFDANHEPGFGSQNQDPSSAGTGESAFNVFDNRLGPANDKWCCGRPGGISVDDPLWVSARLPVKVFLTSFTVSSANDVPERDPLHWAVQGSNDGQNYTDIYVYDDDFAPWDERLQVIQFREVEDFPKQTTSYEYFRLATFDTINNQVGNAAYFQIGEIEYFGNPDGAVPPLFVAGDRTIGLQTFEGDRSNEKFGPIQEGVPGWTGRIVTVDEHGMTLSDHTLAEQALNDFPGVTAIEAYPVVDMAGGGGTFPENLPYPNGVADTSQSDFAVRVEAEVVIPAGSWTIGFGSDDGGQLTIPGVEFLDSSANNTSFDPDQIRFEGNRGHGWTVGTFELAAPLETTIVASFHERGGGDSFEIAVLNDAIVQNASPGAGWELLGNGTFGWSVTTSAAPLVSADLTAGVSATRAWQFDVNGDTGTSDQFVVTNPDPNVFTTILNVDGVEFRIAATGAVSDGEAFTIIDADKITGTPVITSVVAGQNWVFDASTGRVCLGSCPPVGVGDFSGDGVLDIADINALLRAVKDGGPTTPFDLNQDGQVNQTDLNTWVNDLRKTWIGDANLDGEFNTGDLVQIFQRGKFEQDVEALWDDGDWTGNLRFDTGDLVAAFQAGGFEKGPEAAAATAAVPEPSSLALALLSTLGLVGIARRRNG